MIVRGPHPQNDRLQMEFDLDTGTAWYMLLEGRRPRSMVTVDDWRLVYAYHGKPFPCDPDLQMDEGL